MTNPLDLNDISISNLHHLEITSSKDTNDVKGYGRRFTVVDTSTGSREVLVFKNLVNHAKTLAERAETPEDLNEVNKYISKLKIVEIEAKIEYNDRSAPYKFRSWFHRLFGGAFFGSHSARLTKTEAKLLSKMKDDLAVVLKETHLKSDHKFAVRVNNQDFIVDLTHNEEGLSKLDISRVINPAQKTRIELLSSDDVEYTNLQLLSIDATPLLCEIITELNKRQIAENKVSSKSYYTKIELVDGNSPGSILKISKIKQGIIVNKTYRRQGELGSGGMGTAYRYEEFDSNGRRVANSKPKVVKIAHDTNSAKLAMSSGHRIMADQFIDLQGKPVTQIPGLIKPTKSQIGDIALMSLYGSGHAGVKGDNIPNEFNESINFIKQVCFGLNHMHTKVEPDDDHPGKRALVHRDIKGDNIFCREEILHDEATNSDIRVKKYGLADFDGAHEAHINKGTSFTHTKNYISLSDVMLLLDENIDQADMEAFNKSLDVYALGVTIREFITGASIKLFRSDVAETPDEVDWISRGYKNLGTYMSIEDLPIDYRNNLNNEESVKLQGLVNLCNSMTVKNWEDRPTIGDCLAHIQNLGIELPEYPV